MGRHHGGSCLIAARIMRVFVFVSLNFSGLISTSCIVPMQIYPKGPGAGDVRSRSSESPSRRRARANRVRVLLARKCAGATGTAAGSGLKLAREGEPESVDPTAHGDLGRRRSRAQAAAGLFASRSGEPGARASSPGEASRASSS